MGVPVVSLTGARHAARVSHSLLSAAGLGELVADSAEKYEEMAVALATKRERLRVLKASLRESIAHSPLLNHAGFAASVEAASCAGP